MAKVLRLLILEDQEFDAELMVDELRHSGYETNWKRIETEADYVASLNADLDVILADYSLPQFNAPRALAVLQDRNLDIPFIVVTGTVTEEDVVECMQRGAADYLLKDRLARLGPAVERAIRARKLRHEQRQSEAALRESEARFRNMADTAPVMIWLTDVNNQCIYVNKPWLDFTGRSLEQQLGTGWLDPIHPEDLGRVYGAFLRAIESHQPYRSEYRLRRADGVYKWVLDSGSPRFDDDGLFEGYIGSCIDITQRKDDEEALRRSEAAEREQRLFAEALRDITLTRINNADQDVILGRILDNVGQVVPYDTANIMLLEDNELHIAFATGEITWKSHFDAHPISLNAVHNLQQIQATGSPYLVADTRLDPHWLDLRGDNFVRSHLSTPIRVYGQIIGFLNLDSAQPGFFTSSNADRLQAFADEAAIAIENARLYAELQNHAEDLQYWVERSTVELREAKEHAENMLNSSSDAIVLLHGDSSIQQSNPAFRSLFGYSEDEILRLPLTILVTADHASVMRTAVQRVAQSGQAARLELEVHRKDDSPFTADIALAPIHESFASDPRVICSLRDISVQKRSEQELRAALDEERELGDLKSRFIAMASHDFRTPLMTILSSASLVKMLHERELGEISAVMDKHLKKIESSVKHMTELLDGVLTIGRADAGKLEYEPEVLDLAGLCQDILQEVELGATPLHVLTVKFEGNCNEVRADKTLLRYILVNLLTNAVKYSPRGGNIRCEVTCQDENSVIKIQDEGIGIPEKDQNRLYDAFHRAENVGAIQGTGLGLAIVKRAVDRHKGTIKFESRVGAGTTFTVVLPGGAIGRARTGA